MIIVKFRWYIQQDIKFKLWNAMYGKMVNTVLFSMIIGCSLLSGCSGDKLEDNLPIPETREETKEIKLDNANIHVIGAAYVSRTPEKLFGKRFSDDILRAPSADLRFSTNAASSTTGISIQFKTSSPSIHLTFSKEQGLNEKGTFKILRDGVDFKFFSFDGPVNRPIQIDLNSLSTDKEYIYEVILPSYTNFSLTKLLIGINSDLVAYKPTEKKVYISFGDSITHGRGQDGCSFLTYPFLLAQKLNMNLYNLAINGSMISKPIAEMTRELPSAELITVLIAYNDFSSGNRTVVQIENDYRAYLTEIRRSQPSAAIYCITLLYTKILLNAITGVKSEDVRNIVKNIVTEYQLMDNKLHLIEGDKIIDSSTYLSDQVHLNVAGASKLANGLYDKIMTL